MEEKDLFEKIDKNKIPNHVAIIMDGNGRWAEDRKKPRTFGHKAGADNIRTIVESCNKVGVKYLTLYAFSTENWKRPESEVNFLMDLLNKYLINELEELNKNHVKIKSIGDISRIPSKPLKSLMNSIEQTEKNDGLVLTLALNYGFREDLKNAIKKIMKSEFNIDEIDESTIKSFLQTNFLPDPDLIIRTSGEIRLSNFLMFEASYSELYFTKELWPDFNSKSFYKAIIDYQNRDRRYGGLSK